MAAVTPTDPGGNIDLKAFERLVEFLLERGVDGICVGGATSEYPYFDLQERKALISCAAEKLDGRATLLVAAGASTFREALALGQHAFEGGARAVLLPPPHFFHYEQQDLETFYGEACRAFPGPLLLYNLPDFTNPLELETSIRLMRREPHLIGMKDSSGKLDALSRLAQARGDLSFSLFSGSDSVFFEALNRGWDGSVTGLGNLCPELLVREYRSFREGDLPTARSCQELLDDLIRQVAKLPFPWAIRAGLEIWGIPTGAFPLPPSAKREAQLASFRKWYAAWLKLQPAGIPEVKSL